MIRKNYLPILVALVFTGCGGGGTNTAAAGAASNDTSDTNTSASVPIIEDNSSDTNTSSAPSVGPFPAPVLSASDKQDYLDAINNARLTQQDCGVEGIKPAVDPLTWNDKLYSIAAEHSTDLAAWNNGVITESEARENFSHTGSGTDSDWTAQVHDLGRGSTIGERVDNSGYIWRAYGENIAAGTNTSTAVQAVQQWLDSPPHCANLMSSDYTEVGMAMVEDGDSFYTHYWTQNFGTPQ